MSYVDYSVSNQYNALIDVIEASIGPTLHQFPDGLGGTKPAIFKNRAAGQSTGKYAGIMPFAVVSLGPRTVQGARVNASWYDGITGDLIKSTIYNRTCTVAVYGGDAMQLAEDLEHYLVSEAAIQTLLDQNIVVQDTDGVIPNTTTLDGVFQDMAALQFTITTTARLTEESYAINEVNVGLDVNHSDSEITIIHEDITIP